MEAGIPNSVGIECVCRVLRREKMKYTLPKERSDLKLRCAFAKKVKWLLDPKIWTEGIAFYLDGTGFTRKYNPLDQARSPPTMSWRRPADGLPFQHTVKGSHEGTGGKVARFLVAIAYGKGVILAEQHEGNMNGEKFSEFIQEEFKALFERSNNTKGKLFLQDSDPCQNSQKAKSAMDKVGARLFKIPPLSPDINPIQNVFNNIKQELKDYALEHNLTFKNYEDFCERVKRTILNYSPEVIDKTIESMDNRMDLIIKNKGQRLKY